MEEYLKISYENGLPIFSIRPTVEEYKKAISILFNFYINSKSWKSLLSIAQSAEKHYGADSIFERNKATAYFRMGRIDDAEKAYIRAIELDPQNDGTIYWYAEFLDDIGRYQEAYLQHERAILTDPDDGSLYSGLAINILNRGYIRDTGDNLIGPVSRKERTNAAIPLFIHSLHGASQSRRNYIVGVLVRSEAVEEARAIGNGELPKGDFNASCLDSILRKIRDSGE